MNTTNEITERKPLTMTSQRLAANRGNAQKSTGPRTARGRAVASRNARKHGVLARTVVVRGLQIKESTKAFSNLCREFYAQFIPVGPMEETLVDQIASLTWRLRRVRKAEAGEVQLSVDAGWWLRRGEQLLSDLVPEDFVPGARGVTTRLERSSRGCRFLLNCLREVRELVEKTGELTEETISTFHKAFDGESCLLVREMKDLRAWINANPEKLDTAALRARHKEDVRRFLNREMGRLSSLAIAREEREKMEEDSRQSAAALPSPEVLDKIMRYENSLNRQLYQALNHLERLQRRRAGEHVPAPAAANITIENSQPPPENCETNPL